jgi:hypothetical protein
MALYIFFLFRMIYEMNIKMYNFNRMDGVVIIVIIIITTAYRVIDWVDVDGDCVDDILYGVCRLCTFVCSREHSFIIERFN